ncbi:uncharacterized protein LOC135481849 [Liolophura sinensis]|uniref:uncharacterized protein LOC135481849 n=1 Tax=Liolophura sinensis TaxID=3198878 RepID=UPI003158F37B
MATKDEDSVEHTIEVTEEEESGDAVLDEDEILNDHAEGVECEKVDEIGEEGEGSNMDVNDPSKEMQHEECEEVGEGEGTEAECVEDSGNAEIEETGEETEMMTEDAEHSTSIGEDGNNVRHVDSAQDEANVDNNKDVDNTKDVVSADNAEDEDNAVEAKDEDPDEDTALALREFTVLDEVPGEDMERQESKPTDPTTGTKKGNPKVPLCLKLYPLQLEDLQHENIRAFMNKSKFFSARFIGEDESDKQGILYVRYPTFENMEDAKKELGKYKLRDGSQAILKKSIHRDLLKAEFKYIQKKRKPADDPEPVSVFVNNLPSYACENMLKALFPTATSIQLPQKSTGTIQGYGILEYASCQEARAVVRKNKQYAAFIGDNRLRLHVVGYEGINDQKTETSSSTHKATSNSENNKSVTGKKETEGQTLTFESEKNITVREEKGEQLQNNQQEKKLPQNKQEQKKQQEKKLPQNKQQQNTLQREKKLPQNKQQQNARQQEKKLPQNKQQQNTPQENKQQVTQQQNKQQNKQREKNQQTTQSPSSQVNSGKRQRKDSVEGSPKKQRLGRQNDSEKSLTVAKSTRRQKRGDRRRDRNSLSGQTQAQLYAGKLSPGQGSRNRQLHPREEFQWNRGSWTSDRRGQRSSTQTPEMLGAMTASGLQALGLSNVNPGLLQSLKSLVTAQALQTIGNMANIGTGGGMAGMNIDSGRANQFGYSPTNMPYLGSGRDMLMTGGGMGPQTSHSSVSSRTNFHSAAASYSGRSGRYGPSDVKPSSLSAKPRKRRKVRQRDATANRSSVYAGSTNQPFSDNRGGDSGFKSVHRGFEESRPQPSYTSQYSMSYGQSSQPASTTLVSDVPQEQYYSENATSYSTSDVPENRYYSEQPDSYSTLAMSSVPQDRYYSENPVGYSTSDVAGNRYYSENPVLEASKGGMGGYEQSTSQPLKHSTLQIGTDSSGHQHVVGVKPASSDVVGNTWYQNSRAGDVGYSSGGYDQSTQSSVPYGSISAGQAGTFENSYSNTTARRG